MIVKRNHFINIRLKGKVIVISFYEKVEREFDAYCKRTLKNKLVDYKRQQACLRRKELSFDETQQRKLDQFFSTMDEYFADMIQFGDYAIELKDETLYKALLQLSEEKQMILICHYAMGISDREIATQLALPKTTVRYRREAALQRLKSLMDQGAKNE
ncbi:RNA polymerase sigma factor [Zhenpiania hominis]|uniref:Sigma-70 family RNA polymerase sigma factor n=1 Tax=Zhenpiania hominis TaxID=2763644 RepID=A0A923SVQ6_9FIRM|nr:sigma-70 family RNA polymerase sigma factor [Zhenpiania hominis]MBC6679588.1 sigma-70 family RNA polymerase sigma factor [Zhenpiania hominis]